MARVEVSDAGYHNSNLEGSRGRLIRGNTYKDLSTLCVIPVRDNYIHVRIFLAYNSLIKPMNQKFYPLVLTDMEVGKAYEQMVDLIRTNDELKTYKYVLTFETDNVPPPDGVLKLYESIEAGPFDAVGGLYWTKGEGGQPMIYGNPSEMPKTFIPQVPVPEAVQPCNGLGMGFTLWRVKMLQDTRIERPLFETVQKYTPGKGTEMFTQDLRAMQQLGKLGYRFASDNRCKVGHMDLTTGQVW